MPESERRDDANAAIPPTLSHVIGQRQVVEKLRIAVEAAWADSAPLDHVLLTGPAGVGKSMIAKVIAREMATEVHEAMGQSLLSPQAVNGLLLGASSPNAIVFIDEIHEAMPMSQTALFRALDEGAVFLKEAYSDSVTKINLVPFTLVLATTDPQRLLPPLRDRMRLICQLSRYSIDDLAALLRQKTGQCGWQVEESALRQIAQRGMGTPRLALRLLQSARRTARADGATTITQAHVERTFAVEEVDSLGLGPDEQRYLRLLGEAGGPVRLNVLASRLGQPVDAVARVVESNLVWLGLIDRSDLGRALTARGIEHVRASIGRESRLSATPEEP
jgi:Holliday junction DNA helicase RuvB